MNSTLINISAAQLRKAATLKERIDLLQGELAQILDLSQPQDVSTTRRRMSATGRAAIAAGVKARWAKVKGTATRGKPKRRMSAAAKAKISAAAKLRWKKAKAAGKNTL
jgi:hypothetical protein